MQLPTTSEIDFKAIETPLLAQLAREATEELNSRKTKGNHRLMDVINNVNTERQVRKCYESINAAYEKATISELHILIESEFFRPGRQAMNYINNEIFEPNGFERIDINYKKK